MYAAPPTSPLNINVDTSESIPEFQYNSQIDTETQPVCPILCGCIECIGIGIWKGKNGYERLKV